MEEEPLEVQELEVESLVEALAPILGQNQWKQPWAQPNCCIPLGEPESLGFPMVLLLHCHIGLQMSIV
uniref:Uncharacterized protein n=1 Tax=Arundo donax TaxID=35708 RepID=A0A0A8ZQB4_ARUDO